MRRANSRPIARPRPKPPSAPGWLPRRKRSKTSSRSSSGMPGPWSSTAMTGVAPLRPTVTTTGSAGGENRRALSTRIRTTRATLPGSPIAQHGPSVCSWRSSIRPAGARSSNSATTARQSSRSWTGSLRSSTSASRRDRSSRSEASPFSRRACCCARCVWPRASGRSGGTVARSRSSSSSIPWSEASGVRSSCDAVATKFRRARSCCRRRDCIREKARLRSPTSSRPRSLGTSA